AKQKLGIGVARTFLARIRAAGNETELREDSIEQPHRGRQADSRPSARAAPLDRLLCVHELADIDLSEIAQDPCERVQDFSQSFGELFAEGLRLLDGVLFELQDRGKRQAREHAEEVDPGIRDRVERLSYVVGDDAMVLQLKNYVARDLARVDRVVRRVVRRGRRRGFGKSTHGVITLSARSSRAV